MREQDESAPDRRAGLREDARRLNSAFFTEKDTSSRQKINSNSEKKRKKHVRGLKRIKNEGKFFTVSGNQTIPAARPAGLRGLFHATRTMKPDTATAKKVYDKLLSVYGPQKCFLEHMTPFQLLVATILSAQCTDKRVNMVTRDLFKRWPDAEAFASCRQEELEQAIFTCGFYRAKAAHILEASKAIVEQFHGELPGTMDGLLRLPGVGRKTANVVLGDALGQPGFPVDTHVRRLSGLIGLSDSSDPEVIESDICSVMPPETWAQFSHLLIVHGRTRCPANRPDCAACEIAFLCRRTNEGKRKPDKAAGKSSVRGKATTKPAAEKSARSAAKTASGSGAVKTAAGRKRKPSKD